MSVTIQLRPEIEKKLRERAAASGQKLEDFLGMLAEQWAGGPSGATPQAQDLETAKWLAEWYAWVASHSHVTAVADDSRESIYAGRGE